MQKEVIISFFPMNELAKLKMEARILLDAVNQNCESFKDGSGLAGTHYNPGNIFETYTFKERLKMLKQNVKEFGALYSFNN